MRRSVLVDTDIGVDDALALLTVLNEPDADVIGIGTVFGNCTEVQAASNALVVLAAADRLDVPVCIGQSRPGRQPKAPSPHGSDGLGDRGLVPPSGATPSAETAVDQILRVGRERPSEVDLLCLGPLANVAAALEQDPLILTRYRAVTIMGGMGPVDRRDTESAAQPLFLAKGDTNTNHAPAASAAVAAAPGPVTWVGMNVTGRLRMPWADLTALAGHSTTAAFVRDITTDYHRYCTTTYRSAEPIYTSHDSVAAAAMLDPTVVLSAADLTGHILRASDGRASLWGQSVTQSDRHRFAFDLDYTAIRLRINAVLGARVAR